MIGKDALGLKALRVVETGGGAWIAQREQWDDGNVVALAPASSSAMTPYPPSAIAIPTSKTPSTTMLSPVSIGR